MKKKDIKLFNKAIHQIKQVATEISKERQAYHEEMLQIRKEQREMRKGHDRAVKKEIKELLKVVDEMYELFSDLTNERGK